MLESKIAGLSLLSLGGISFIPFFVSGEKKELSVKVNGDEAAIINFVSPASASNQMLKGSWVLLNKKKSDEKTLFSSAGFDIAVSTKFLADSYEKSDITDKKIRIFYCSQNNGDDMVRARTISADATIYCKDLSDSYYLGLIKGKHYRAIFAAIKDGFFKQGAGKSIDSLLKLTKDNKGDLHDKLAESLKLAAGPKKDFSTSAIIKNLENNDCLKKGHNRENTVSECFFWGMIPAVGAENQNDENCKSKDSFEGCEIEIINVSGDTTLKSFSSFWTFGENTSVPTVI